VGIASTILTVLISGLQQGAIFALLGIGLTIILGTMKFLNLAHGALYLVGAYVGLVVSQEVRISTGLLGDYVQDPTAFGLGWGFFPALIVVPVVLFFVGVLMERFVARPLYDRSEFEQLLITFGLAILTGEVVKVLMGTNPFSSYAPSTLFGLDVSGPITLPVAGQFTAWRLLIIVLTVCIIGLTYLAIEKTDFGLVVQGGTHDAEMIRLLGIDVSRSNMIVFGIGAALAGLAGLVGATIIQLNPQMGTDNALIPAFLVIVVGGAGSVTGAIVGGFALGIVLATMQIVAAQWSQIILFSVVAVVLLVRPEGLFGSVEVGQS